MSESKKNRLKVKIFNISNTQAVNFLLGTLFKKENLEDRRKILFDFLNNNTKSLNFIIEEISFEIIKNEYNLEYTYLGFDDYKIYEQIISEIADNNFIFLDSIATGYEYGMFTMTYNASLKNVLLLPNDIKNIDFILPGFIKTGPKKWLDKIYNSKKLKDNYLIWYDYELDDLELEKTEFNKKIRYIKWKNNTISNMVSKIISERVKWSINNEIKKMEIDALVSNLFTNDNYINFELSFNLLFKLICNAQNSNDFFKLYLFNIKHSSINIKNKSVTLFIETLFEYLKYYWNIIGYTIKHKVKINIKTSIMQDEIDLNIIPDEDIKYLEGKNIIIDKFNYWIIRMNLLLLLIFLTKYKNWNRSFLQFVVTDDENKFLEFKIVPETNFSIFKFQYIVYKFKSFLGDFKGLRMVQAIYNLFIGIENFYYIIENQPKIKFKNNKLYKSKNKTLITYKESKLGESIKIIHWIFLLKLYKNFTINEHCYSYIKGRNIYDAVNVHKNSKIFLKLDIKNFFSSIDLFELYEKITLNPNFNSEYLFRDIFFKLFSTNKKGLPIGFACSGYLSNIFLNDFDLKVVDFLEEQYGKNKFKYSRYSDDILISSNFIKYHKELNNIQIFITNELKKIKLRLNKEKIQIINSKKQKHIKFLGVNIIFNKDKLKNKLTVGKRYKLNFYISSIKYFNQNYKNPYELMRLKGCFQHLKNIEQPNINYLLNDLEFYYKKIIKSKLKNQNKFDMEEFKVFFKSAFV